MTLLPHLAARLFGVPLAIHRPKLDVILAVLGSRVGLADLAPPAPTPPARAASSQTPKVAVIPIHGTLVRRTVGLEAESGLISYASLCMQLDTALASPDVAAILLDIDSPGGESGGVFDLADRIRVASKVKPVWAVANDMAFSAAYALASASRRVWVSRTGGVGSIGVIAMHVDRSGKDAMEGLRYTAVFAGERKNDLNPHEAICDAAHAVLRAEVNRIYELFVETVARHRGIEPGAVRATEAGLFFGQDAVAMGLADAVGSFDDALAQLYESISSSPMVAAARGSFLNLQMESSMNDPTDPAADDKAADPADRSSEPPNAASMTLSEAVEVAQTCALAGRSDLILGFLEAQAKPALVRSQLLAAQADASPEIVSRIDPQSAGSAAHPASAHNPLIQAVKSRLGVA